MNQDEKQKLFNDAGDTISGGLIIWDLNPANVRICFELIFHAAQKDGRESILKAMHELAGDRQSIDRDAFEEAASGRQSVDTLKALGDWCALAPEINFYTVEQTKKESDFKRWMIILRHDLYIDTERYRTIIYGSTHADCLAKGAQFCLLEIERANRLMLGT